MRNFVKILIFSLLAIATQAQQATEIDSKSVRLPRYASPAAVTVAIPTPIVGMMIFRLDTKSNWYYDGTAWKDMAVSSVSVPSPLYLTSTGTTISGETNQADEAGVLGINTTTGVGYAVLGKTTSTNPDENTIGVKGENMSTNGVGFGVMGRHEGTGWAGYFEGYNALKTQGNTYLNGDVGIGTDSPFGKLTINTQSVGWNFPSLLLIDDATDNTGGAILQFRNPADKRMYLQSHFGTQSDGTDSYMTFSHNAFYNMRLRGDGNLGIGSLNPNLAGLVVNKKVGNSHAIFGDNTSGVSIESNFPGIHFNSYYNGSRKTISTGFTAGVEMNPTTGDFSIYTSPTSTTAGSTASVFERLKITKDGVVNVGPFFNVNNPNALNIGVANNISFGGSNYTTGFISTIGTSNSAARMAFYTGYSFTGGASSMQERMTISNTGNVGIANTNPTQKLEVNGKIKIADDANAAVAGNVRWNSTTHDFEGYDGTQWKSLTKSSSDTWSSELKDLNENGVINNPTDLTNFGYAIETSGNLTVIGAWGIDGGGGVTTSNFGKVFLFTYNENTSTWQLTTTINDPDAANNWFGYSISLNAGFMAIGAPNAFVAGVGSMTGKVHIYNTSGVLLNTINGAVDDGYFGSNVEIGPYGHLAIFEEMPNNSGRVHTYFLWGNGTPPQFLNTIAASVGGVFFGVNMQFTSDHYLLIRNFNGQVAVYRLQTSPDVFVFHQNLTSTNSTFSGGINHKELNNTGTQQLFIFGGVGKALIFSKNAGSFTEQPPINTDYPAQIVGSVELKDNLAFLNVNGEIQIFGQYGNNFTFKRKLKSSTGLPLVGLKVGKFIVSTLGGTVAYFSK